MNVSAQLLIIPVSYLLGCFTTGYYLVRLISGQDIREVASGNLGSRNVGRLMGAKGFLLTFIGDGGKGLLVVWVAHRLGGGQVLGTAALLAATAGHIWPLQLRFRGGKGFATYGGGMLLLSPMLLLFGLALCGLIYPLLRRTTVTGLAALAFTPFLLLLMEIRVGGGLNPAELGLYCLLVLLVLYGHRDNIRQAFRKSVAQE